MDTEHQEKGYSFFQNKKCEFFPCHKTCDDSKFNCLFCFCPLYFLGHECGGNPVFLEDSTKDCSKCSLPHNPEKYNYILQKFSEIKKEMIDFEEYEQKIKAAGA